LSAVLVIWELFPLFVGVPSYVFPRPSEALTALWQARELLKQHLLVTAAESVAGFFLGGLVGFTTGLCMAQWPTVRRTILPYVVASNAIPVVAIAPIVVLWFGHGLWSKCVVAAFLCFFPSAINTYRGLTEYEPIYSEIFRVYAATPVQFLVKFQLPNAAPFVFAGMRLSATFAVIGAIVAEFVGSDRGLGFGMLQATYNLNTPRLYGYLIVSCILGVLMYGAVVLVEHLLFPLTRPSNRVSTNGRLPSAG
ncbi:MAG: ABC transporter permease, partial [Gammaproteobacteria bacterium]